MRFIFDFDYTLFNTQAMREAYIHILSDAFFITEEQYYAAEKIVTADGQLYSLDAHLHVLFPLSDDREKAFTLIEGVMHDAGRFLYNDVIRELHTLKQHQHELILLTFGDQEWQQYKIEHTEIPKFMHRIEIVDTSKTNTVDLFVGEDIVCVNDKASEIDELSQAFPHVTYVWISRENVPYADQTPTVPHIAVSQLSDISL